MVDDGSPVCDGSGSGGGGSVLGDGANSNGSDSDSGLGNSLKNSKQSKKGGKGKGKGRNNNNNKSSSSGNAVLSMLGVAAGSVMTGAMTVADRLTVLQKKRRTGTVLSVRTLRVRVVWRLAQVSLGVGLGVEWVDR